MKRIALKLSTIVLMLVAFMVVPMNSALASLPSCNYNSAVTLNNFLLGDENGKFIGPADPYDDPHYYPYIRDSINDAGRFSAEPSTSAALYDGQEISILTLDKDGWYPGWYDYDHLGKFADRSALYYWEPYGDKTIWEISRPTSSLNSGRPIQWDEQVYVRNKNNNEFLTYDEEEPWLETEGTTKTWSFIDPITLNLEFAEIEYHFDYAEFSNEGSIVLAETEYVNASDIEREITVEVGYEITQSSYFDQTDGYSKTKGGSFSMPIPTRIGDVESELEWSTTDSHDLTVGQEESVAMAAKTSVTTVVPGRSTGKIKIVATEADALIPYTMTFDAPDGSIIESCGTWSGTVAYLVHAEVTIVPNT